MNEVISAMPPISDPALFHTGITIVGGMAPCITYFDARSISITRSDVLSWNFGDGQDLRLNPCTGKMVNVNSALTTQIVGHWYLNPGTYKGSCTVSHINGTKSIYPFTVQIYADTRTQAYFAPNGNDKNNGSANSPFLSAAKFYALSETNNIHIHLATGMSMLLPGCVQVGSNIVIDGGGSKLLLSPNALGFAGTIGHTSDVLIHHIAFDSTNPTGNQAVRMRGTRIAFLDCTLGNIGRGIEIEDNHSDCILLQGIVQLVPIWSQVFYIEWCQ